MKLSEHSFYYRRNDKKYCSDSRLQFTDTVIQITSFIILNVILNNWTVFLFYKVVALNLNRNVVKQKIPLKNLKMM